jgi:hypothetical protein
MEEEWKPKWKCSLFGWSGGFLGAPNPPASQPQAAAAGQTLFSAPGLQCTPGAEGITLPQNRTIDRVSVGVNKAKVSARARDAGLGAMAMESSMRCDVMQQQQQQQQQCVCVLFCSGPVPHWVTT